MLEKIKLLIRSGKYRFTYKAELELARCWIEGEEILEAILEASKIDKVENSYNPSIAKNEKLYIIKNWGFYIKGKIKEDYIIISSKRDTDTR